MPRLQHNQPYNAKFQNEQITIKWQCLNTKPSIKHEITKFPYKEIQKIKLTLKSILECEAWVLGSWRSPSSSFHSSDGWYFFPLKVREDGVLEDAIINAKKWKFGDGFQKWVCNKIDQEHKDLKKWLREMNESKLRNLGKWFSREEMV